MGRVPARLNVINAALVDIWLCGYASIRSTQGGVDISPNCFWPIVLSQNRCHTRPVTCSGSGRHSAEPRVRPLGQLR